MFSPFQKGSLTFLFFAVSTTVAEKNASDKAPAASAPETPAPAVSDSFPADLLNVKGEKIPRGSLKGKFVGVYFSASWCPPCRTFTPKLIEFRNKHKKEFEVVLVASEASAKAQANYMKKYEMPWLAVENQSIGGKLLAKRHRIQFIPTLVVLAPDGEIVTSAAMTDVKSIPEKALSKWKKKAG